MQSGIEANGRFGKQHFVYLSGTHSSRSFSPFSSFV